MAGRRFAPARHDRLLAEIVSSTSESIIVTSPDGVIVEWNQGAERLYGYTREEAVGQDIEIVAPPELVQRFRSVRSDVIRHGSAAVEGPRARKDGTMIEVAGTVSSVRDETGELLAMVGISRDVTEQRRTRARLEESERRLLDAQQLAGLGSWEFDPGRNHVELSASLRRLFGMGSKDFAGTFEAYLEVVHPDDRALPIRAVDSILEGRADDFEFEHRIVRPDGEVTWVRVRARGVRGDGGGTPRLFGTALDVTEQKRAEERERAHFDEMRRMAFFDQLTGLANRALLQDRLSHALTRRGSYRTAVLLLDLDNFKTVNDVGGHVSGDEALVEAGRRILSCVRTQDTVARLGGDEFAVVLEEVAGPEAALAVADRIRSALSDPMTVGGQEFVVGASVGVTLDGSDGRSAEDLLRHADTAMYEAKASGKGTFALFERDMHERLLRRSQLAADLRRGLREGQLRLLYQPQVECPSGRVEAVEALVRWEHPERGLLGPAEFIPLAETTRMIVELDDWVLREACRQLREWDEAGLPVLSMCVNVSVPRLEAGQLAKRIEALLNELGLEGRRLEIEVTESVALGHEQVALGEIERLRDLGVRVAIDDFGVGHSSLSRLHAFPLDRIKIDRAFVSPLTEGTEQGSLAEAMIAMAHSLGLAVIAEGVETAEQLRALHRLGCRRAQGFLFSRPVTPAAIAALASEGAITVPLPDGHRGTESVLSTRGERRVRTLLAELQRLTGLESAYLTSVDWEEGYQYVTHAHNTGALEIPERLNVAWDETLCRRALDRGIRYTDDASATFADTGIARELGIRTYASVPIAAADGRPVGTLCGASRQAISLGPAVAKVMEAFAALIGEELGP